MFYALKDARTPLCIGILGIAVHIALLLLLFHLLSGRNSILAIPLAASLAGTLEAACLSVILCARLRKKVRTDQGWLRLKMRRAGRVGSARARGAAAHGGEVS